MKTKPKPEKTTSRGKPQLEDGVRAALIGVAIICAAVLGIGGFFAVRSVLSGDKPDISLLDEIPGTSSIYSPEMPAGSTDEPPTDEAAVTPPDTLSSADADTLPELDQAIRDLQAAGAGAENAADTANAAPAAPAAPAAGTSAAAPAPQVAASKPQTATAPGTQTPAARKSVLVLVIDDAGNNLRDLDPFLKFPGPITICVLPGLANSAEAARRIRAAGKELFLHQPMEPMNGQDPGPKAIKTGMNPAEIKDILVKNLNEIGPVSGFNNHEGSLATSDPAIMRPVLELSRSSGLLFLDSRTTANTVAPQIAKEMGMAIVQRDVFLDNEQDRDSILAALESGCKRAEQNGIAVFIGHTWTPTLASILTEMYPKLTKRGFVFASVGMILSRGK